MPVTAVLPPYLNDLYGAKNATSIYGRVLTGWAASVAGGPILMTYLRDGSHAEQLAKLAERVDPAQFAEAFGAPVSEMATLSKANAVTIPRLLELLPEGTQNPSYMLYDSTLYTMAGVVGLACIANALVRPIPRKYFVSGRGGPPCRP